MADMLAGRIVATDMYDAELPSGRTQIDYEDPDKPVTVFSVAHYNGDYAAALTDALAANGILEFAPETTITGSTPLILTKNIEIRGFGNHSRFAYTGTGDPIRALFADSTVGQGTYIHDLRISGTNLEGQNGISFNQPGVAFPRNVHIHDVEIDGVLNGDGIFMLCPINCTIERNKIQEARRCIALRTPCGTSVEKNWLNYWANSAIHMFGVSGDGLASRCNSALENIIHGDPEQIQDVPADRAGIVVDGVSSSRFDGYKEDIDEPPSGVFVGHGIWFRKTGSSLTQDNEVSGGFFGPNLTGDAVLIDSGVTHSTIRRCQIGAYVVRDNGSFTYFDYLHMSTIDQLQGSGTNRRGNISLSSGAVVQQHA
jgi:hypothetical protein